MSKTDLSDNLSVKSDSSLNDNSERNEDRNNEIRPLSNYILDELNQDSEENEKKTEKNNLHFLDLVSKNNLSGFAKPHFDLNALKLKPLHKPESSKTEVFFDLKEQNYFCDRIDYPLYENDNDNDFSNDNKENNLIISKTIAPVLQNKSNEESFAKNDSQEENDFNHCSMLLDLASESNISPLAEQLCNIDNDSKNNPDKAKFETPLNVNLKPIIADEQETGLSSELLQMSELDIDQISPEKETDCANNIELNSFVDNSFQNVPQKALLSVNADNMKEENPQKAHLFEIFPYSKNMKKNKKFVLFEEFVSLYSKVLSNNLTKKEKYIDCSFSYSNKNILFQEINEYFA
ncbi:MAG: hypothetical protein Q4C95_06940 [Planctomycetia bacterium]|nr:hypothetical protein [Planctomycetia bacterium]